jgi:hypothetical protein
MRRTTGSEGKLTLKKWALTLICSLLLSSAATAAVPQTSAPGDANRTALIYTGYAPFADGVAPRNWKPADFQPFLTYMAKDPQTGKLKSVNTKMFDTFLFLSPWASNRTDAKGLYDISGMYADHTQGNKAEWQAWLDGNFAAGAQLDALAQAVRDYARPLTPEYKARVVMMIPYPDPSVTEWDKGVSFQDVNHRIAAVKWFIQSFLKRYQSSKTSFDGKPFSDYLEFTGFYWMKENFSDDWQKNKEDQLILDVNEYVDSLPTQDGKQLRTYAIPYMSAEAYSARVKGWGFDFGWIQPSHYFHGTPGSTASLERADGWGGKYGLGVELEADWRVAADEYYHKLLRDYLDFGSENGWMSTPIALYSDIDSFGTTTLDHLAGNTNKPLPNLRQTYDDLYLFLNDAYNPHKLSIAAPVSTKVRTGLHNTHKIELQAGSMLTFRLESQTGNADLYLLDENFQPLAWSHRLNGYRDEISYPIAKTGTYYVRVAGSADSNYTASIQSGSVKNGYSPTTALDGSIGQTVRKRVNSLEDTFFKVSLQQGQTYTITAKPGSTTQDVDVYLYANAVNDIGSLASHKGPAAAEQIAFTAEQSGEHYVMIRGGQMPSEYELQIQTGKQPAPEDGYEAATAFALPVDGKLTHGILKDQSLWYKVPVEKGRTYTLLMNPQAGLDVDIDLFSSLAATANVRGDLTRSDRGPGIPDAVVYTAPEAGFVYLKARSFGEGSYQMTVLPGSQLPAGYTPDNPILLTDSHSYQVNKGDVVYYALPTEAGKDYLISLQPNTGDMNADLEIYDSTDTSAANRVGVSRKGNGDSEQVLVQGRPGKTYILKVSGITETRYSLRAETPAADGRSPINGKRLQPGQPAAGTLAQGQAEYAKVWLEKGRRYQILAASLGQGQDVDLDLYQSITMTPENLVGSSHGPLGYQDRVTFTPLTSGYYFVKVQGYTNVQYQLQVAPQ